MYLVNDIIVILFQSFLFYFPGIVKLGKNNLTPPPAGKQ